MRHRLLADAAEAPIRSKKPRQIPRLFLSLTYSDSSGANALKGDRAGQWSIRINNQWRICFRWHDGGAENVEIVDYH